MVSDAMELEAAAAVEGGTGPGDQVEAKQARQQALRKQLEESVRAKSYRRAGVLHDELGQLEKDYVAPGTAAAVGGGASSSAQMQERRCRQQVLQKRLEAILQAKEYKEAGALSR